MFALLAIFTLISATNIGDTSNVILQVMLQYLVVALNILTASLSVIQPSLPLKLRETSSVPRPGGFNEIVMDQGTGCDLILETDQTGFREIPI